MVRSMRQLNGIDVAFLNMENPTTFGHVSSLSIYDPTGAPGGGGYEATRRMLLERIHMIPPFRQRLMEVPFGLDRPYWVDDPDFDIDFHLRHHAVPPPGTPEQLAEVISRIVARPLDRAHPLWELYVIEGVDDGRLIAQLTKVHHAAIDGVGGATMLATMLDTDPAARPGEPMPWEPEPTPTPDELTRRALADLMRSPAKMMAAGIRTFRDIAHASRSGALHSLADIVAQPIPGKVGDALRRRRQAPRRDDDAPPALPLTPAPRTPFNAPISRHRRFAYTTVDLAQAKQIRRAVGCTFNDVVMALCSGTLRRYLLAHDCLPEDPLIAMVPISVRTGEEETPYGNRVSALFADLATDEPDPLARLARIQQAMNTAKTQFDPISADILQDVSQFLPPAIATRALRMASRLHVADRMNPPFNLIISNVPGPPQPLYSSGAELRHYYPVSAIVDGQGLNMTVQSYNGRLDFGFLACRELVPDVWDMMDMLHESLDELLTAIEPPPPKSPVNTTPAKKAATKKTPTKKTAAKKTAAKKTAAKQAPATPRRSARQA